MNYREALCFWYNEAVSLDKRTAGYKRRRLSMTKGTEAIPELLGAAKAVGIPAKYVLFDSRFSSPRSLHDVKKLVMKCLITADTSLCEEEIIRLYGKRRDIEVLFKVCKSYLRLSKKCHSFSFDAVTAHTAVVFTRYKMLSIENRESNDNRSLGELFLYFTDEMSDITWLQALSLLV